MGLLGFHRGEDDQSGVVRSIRPRLTWRIGIVCARETGEAGGAVLVPVWSREERQGRSFVYKDRLDLGHDLLLLSDVRRLGELSQECVRIGVDIAQIIFVGSADS